MPSVIDRNHIGVNDTLSLGILNVGYDPWLGLELGNILNFIMSQNHFVKKVIGCTTISDRGSLGYELSSNINHFSIPESFTLADRPVKFFRNHDRPLEPSGPSIFKHECPL